MGAFPGQQPYSPVDGVPEEPDHQFKIPVVQRSDYTILFEQPTKTQTLIHCDIHSRWSKEIKQALAADFDALVDLHGGPIHAQHTPGDAKHLKFITLYGFTYSTSFVDPQGRPMEIYTRRNTNGRPIRRIDQDQND